MKTIQKKIVQERMWAFVLFFLVEITAAYAQQVKVSGKVSDTNNEPMIGVSILEK